MHRRYMCMKKLPKKNRYTILTLICLLSISCSARWTVQGQVVDAQTADPIENAAVWIYWSKSGSGPPGLAGSVIVEIAEDLTDTQGRFLVPKYSTLLAFLVLEEGHDKYPASAPDARRRADPKNGGYRD